MTERERIEALVPGIELVECDLTNEEQTVSFFEKMFGEFTERDFDHMDLLRAITGYHFDNDTRRESPGDSSHNGGFPNWLHEHGVHSQRWIDARVAEAADRADALGFRRGFLAGQEREQRAQARGADK